MNTVLASFSSWLRVMAGAMALSTGMVAAAQSLTVSCAVEPTLVSGTALTLTAWAMNASGKAAALPDGVHWRADRGAVEAGRVESGVAVKWTLPESPPQGLARASLVRPNGGVVCTVMARRVPGIRGQVPANATARARHFLVREREAPGGYAALAYLLLPAPPAPAERERCLRVLAAWLRLLPPTAEMELYVERDQLTLFLLPLREVPSLKLDSASVDRSGDQAWRAAAQALLAQYDHARAQALLAKMGLAGVGSGPLLATLQTSSTAQTGVLLVEDFASVDPTIVEPWLRWSLSLISQPRERSTEALQRLAMSLRNVIAHAARDMPDGGAVAREGVRLAALPGR